MDCINIISSGQEPMSPQEITDFIKIKHQHLISAFNAEELYNEQTYNKIVEIAFSGVNFDTE